MPKPNLSKSKPPKQKGRGLNIEISFGRVSLIQKSLFAKHMSVMLKSGLNIIECLEIAHDEAQGKFKKIMKGVLTAVTNGVSLNQSLARYPSTFNRYFVNSVRVGETSGTLEENFKALSQHLEKEQRLIGKIRAAMVYPIIVLTAAFFIGIAVSFLVLPKITPIFKGLKIELPTATKVLLWFADFVANYGLIALVVLIIFLIFFFSIIRRPFVHPVTHWILLRLPIVSKISRNANLVRFTRTLGMLLQSGLNIDEALEITGQTVNNYYYKKALKEISIRISKGSRLSENLSNYPHLFPRLVSSMIGVGEESGRLDETLLYLAEYYDFEVDNSVRSLSTAIEPILLIFIGLIVAVLALAVITPIYQITGNVRV